MFVVPQEYVNIFTQIISNQNNYNFAAPTLLMIATIKAKCMDLKLAKASILC